MLSGWEEVRLMRRESNNYFTRAFLPTDLFQLIGDLVDQRPQISRYRIDYWHRVQEINLLGLLSQAWTEEKLPFLQPEEILSLARFHDAMATYLFFHFLIAPRDYRPLFVRVDLAGNIIVYLNNHRYNLHVIYRISSTGHLLNKFVLRLTNYPSGAHLEIDHEGFYLLKENSGGSLIRVSPDGKYSVYLNLPHLVIRECGLQYFLGPRNTCYYQTAQHTYFLLIEPELGKCTYLGTIKGSFAIARVQEEHVSLVTAPESVSGLATRMAPDILSLPYCPKFEIKPIYQGKRDNIPLRRLCLGLSDQYLVENHYVKKMVCLNSLAGLVPVCHSEGEIDFDRLGYLYLYAGNGMLEKRG